MNIQEFIGKSVRYDIESQQIYNNDNDQLLLDVRGWGAIQNLFEKGLIDTKKASDFQDEIGQFISDAINEKLKTTSKSPCSSCTGTSCI